MTRKLDHTFEYKYCTQSCHFHFILGFFVVVHLDNLGTFPVMEWHSYLEYDIKYEYTWFNTALTIDMLYQSRPFYPQLCDNHSKPLEVCNPMIRHVCICMEHSIQTDISLRYFCPFGNKVPQCRDFHVQDFHSLCELSELYTLIYCVITQ